MRPWNHCPSSKRSSSTCQRMSLVHLDGPRRSSAMRGASRAGTAKRRHGAEVVCDMSVPPELGCQSCPTFCGGLPSCQLFLGTNPLAVCTLEAFGALVYVVWLDGDSSE